MCRQAYIEFVDKESSIRAKNLSESLFKGRQLTVMPKRKNIRGKSVPRGGGFGRGNPMAMFQSMFRMMGRGYRGGFRGRGRGGFGRGRGGGPPMDQGTGEHPKYDQM